MLKQHQCSTPSFSHITASTVMTMTTGDEFAPYSSEQHWLNPELGLDIYILHDERISTEKLIVRLNEIGLLGYGKDATIGKGRFHVQPVVMPELPEPSESQMLLTLARTLKFIIVVVG